MSHLQLRQVQVLRGGRFSRRSNPLTLRRSHRAKNTHTLRNTCAADAVLGIASGAQHDAMNRCGGRCQGKRPNNDIHTRKNENSNYRGWIQRYGCRV
jgi:hypothetical protein